MCAAHASGLVAACGGGKIYADDDGAGGATSSTASLGPTTPLKQTCEAFCDVYQPCAPVASCMQGCIISPTKGCEAEYIATVDCITREILGCNVPSDRCVTEHAAYNSCQMMAG